MKSKGFDLLKKDICNNYKGIIIVIIYFVITHCLFVYVCPFRLLTGLPCPACGLTRAGISLILLDFDKVIYYNPIIVPIALIIIYCIITRYILGRTIKYLPALVAVTSVLLFVYYYYRMITMFPDHKPMEYVPDNLLSPVYALIKQLMVS